MAKQKEINEDFSFGNISKANEKFSKKEKAKKSQMNIRVNKQAYFDFGKLHSRFIAETGLFDSMRESKEFWKIAILEMRDYMEAQGVFEQAPENFSKMVRRAGKRPQGERYYPEAELITTSFGVYHDDTLDIYDNLMYSLARKDGMSHVKEYSRTYFFYDVLSYLEKNIDHLIEKHKV